MKKKIISFHKENIKKCRVLGDCSRFLKSGKYTFNKSYDVLYIKSNGGKKYLNKYLSETYEMRVFKRNVKAVFLGLLRTFYTKKLKNKSNTLFEGTHILVKSHESRIKIFDFQKKLILNIFKEESHYIEAIEAYDYFSTYFTSPQIITNDKDSKLYIEELIDFKKHEKWTDKDKEIILNEIFDSYYNYYILLHRQEEYSLETFDGDVEPIIKVHGDLYSSNILYDEKDIYFIDFEYTKESYFLYDIFLYFWYEYYLNNSSTLLSNYLNGVYDHFFEKAYKIFGLKFNSTRRRKSLEIFFLLLNSNSSKVADFKTKYLRDI